MTHGAVTTGCGTGVRDVRYSDGRGVQGGVHQGIQGGVHQDQQKDEKSQKPACLLRPPASIEKRHKKVFSLLCFLLKTLFSSFLLRTPYYTGLKETVSRGFLKRAFS